MVEALRAVGCSVRLSNPRKGRARCPAHHDQRPSLSVTRKDDRVLLFCHSGCQLADILGRLQLRMADLFAAPRPTASRRECAVYRYRDQAGTVIAEKTRFEPKDFRWRRPDPVASEKWISGLDGLSPGLYYGPDHPADVRSMFLVEGEKSVDVLRAAGVSACCPPNGASEWRSAWTQELQQLGCRDVVILPDHDRAGAAHALKVALALSGLITAKILPLPHLGEGEDVCDFLGDGHAISELLALAAAMPPWDPERRARDRQDRKRAMTAARVRRFRARQRQHRVARGSDWAEGSDGHATLLIV